MINLAAESIAEFGEDYFFITKGMNLIYKINKNTGKLSFVTSLPDENVDYGRVGAAIIPYEDELIFLPMNGYRVYIYKPDTDTFRFVEIEHRPEHITDKFFNGVILNGRMYMIANCYNAIVSFDIKSGADVKYYDEPYAPLIQGMEEKNDCMVRTDFVVKDEKIYMASCVSNCIIIFDTRSEKTEFVYVGDKNDNFVGITFDGKDFWLSARRTSKLYRWNQESDLFEAYQLFDIEKENLYFLGIIYDGKNIILPGMFFDKTCILDPEAIRKDSKNPTLSMKVIDEKYLFFKVSDDKLFTMTVDGRFEIRSVSDIFNIEFSKSVLCDEKELYKYINASKDFVYENEFLTLDSFLDGISKSGNKEDVF